MNLLPVPAVLATLMVLFLGLILLQMVELKLTDMLKSYLTDCRCFCRAYR